MIFVFNLLKDLCGAVTKEGRTGTAQAAIFLPIIMMAIVILVKYS